MLRFDSDYTEGAHEKILERLMETNRIQTSGYGTDEFTRSAIEKIRAAAGCPGAQITFLAGGTQANQIVIDTALRPYEGVVSVETGHINCHEAGAVEFSGHKVLPLPHHLGKMDAGELRELLRRFWEDDNREHMVFPGLVYITCPTEYGTLYSRDELLAIKAVCREYELPLFLDGARLGYGLASPACDYDLPFLAKTVDIFTIGGTKVGALLGEAVVYTAGNQPPHFVAQVKQHGALLAKGRVIGIQFDTLFTEDLYLSIARHAIEMAEKLKDGLQERGCRFFLESPTNQQFVILPKETLERLRHKVSYSVWEPFDEGHTVVRFATSWATTPEMVDRLLSLM